MIRYFANVYNVPGEPHYVGELHDSHAEADSAASGLGLRRIGVLRIERKATIQFIERVRT